MLFGIGAKLLSDPDAILMLLSSWATDAKRSPSLTIMCFETSVEGVTCTGSRNKTFVETGEVTGLRTPGVGVKGSNRSRPGGFGIGLSGTTCYASAEGSRVDDKHRRDRSQ